MTVTPPDNPYDPLGPGPAPRPTRRRRRLVVGVVAGAVLAVAAAIPLTWAAQEAIPYVVAKQQQATGTDDDERGDPRRDRTDRPALFPSGKDGEDAAADAETGVVLVDTVLPGGAGAGTGVVLSEDGLVLTNYHVVDGASEITTTLAATGETYSGEVVGYDQAADVALVRLDGVGGLDEVRLDDDGDDDEVGDPVTAIGNARGRGNLVTVDGTITAIDQQITTSPPHVESLTGLLETDAAAVPGYSGGPMVDAEGEVVGVTTAASSDGAGESYAVPIDDALAIVEQIVAGDDTGTVHVGPPAYLGITVADDGGASVVGVVAGSPAADTGLETGDRITAVDGVPVGDVDALLAMLDEHEPGDSVDLTWTSDGQPREGTVDLAESPYA